MKDTSIGAQAADRVRMTPTESTLAICCGRERLCGETGEGEGVSLGEGV